MYGGKFIARGLMVLVAAISVGVVSASAQGPGAGRIEPPRDETKEITAKHNLSVARWYLTKRKAYEGARDRLQEIIESYPEFSRMDEVLYLMGEAQVKLGKPDTAIDYYEKLMKDYPASELIKKAQSQLEKLKNEKVKG